MFFDEIEHFFKDIDHTFSADDYEEDYDRCWNTGSYDGEDCEWCPHKNICSGYEEDED